jgi:two-component system response regulator HydG
MAHICICDDEVGLLKYLKKLLKKHQVTTFSRGADLLAHLESPAGERVELLLQDLRLPDFDGIQILQRVKERRPGLPVIMLTAYATVDDAVKAIKLGAYDYLTKPCPNEKLLNVVENVLRLSNLTAENRRLRETLAGGGEESIVFASPRFREVYDLTLKVASSDANILILGESGTGKELIASALHHNSARRNNPFVSLNCASLSDTLLESQLFGHLRGAFTGAFANQKGMLEEADGGTLFLDEIGDVSPSVQGKLLRVIQERDFIPIGSTVPKKVDVRFVAATNKELQFEVSEGHFREDLYYRLNVITINLPPLRERFEDIEPLARHFLGRFSERMAKDIRSIEPKALEALQAYSWPGNVRELENVMERAVILTNGSSINADVIPLCSGQKAAFSAPIPANQSKMVALEEMERQHIDAVLKGNRYNKSRTAEILGISRRTLDRRIADFGLMAWED